MESNKKNILVFIEWYSPGFRAGGPIRSMENLVALMSEEYNFYVVTSAYDHMCDKPYANVRINQWNNGPRGEKIYYNGSRRLKPMRIIKSIDVVFDAVYINGVYSRDYSIIPTQFFRHHPRLIVAPRGMLAKHSIAIKRFRKNAFLDIAQVLGHFKTSIFHVTSDKEREEILHLQNKATLISAGNVPWLDAPRIRSSKAKGELKVVYFGRISKVKNLNFFLEAFNGVVGKVELIIVGQEDDPSYASETHQLIRASRQKIEVHAAMSREQMIELFEGAHAFAVPSLTENFGHSVVEGMSFGLLPLVSDQTPWNELIAMAGERTLPLQLDEWSKELRQLVDMGQDEFQKRSDEVAEVVRKEVLSNTEGLRASYRELFG